MAQRWKNLFKPWILERGQDYYECGWVFAIDQNESVIRARVSGSQLYRVEIQRSGECVVRMHCDCPYADGGENCKHMAAVLFALDRETEAEAMNWPSVPEAHVESRADRVDWQTALEQLPAEKLRELLRSLAEGDGSLQDRIVRMVSGPGDDPEQWHAELEQIVLDHTDYRGEIIYGHEYDCMADLAAYLDECLPYVLINGRGIDAAKLVMAVYGTAFNQDMDDSDGGLTLVMVTCRTAMAQVLSQADAQQEREIFDLLHEFLEKSNWNWGSDDLEEWILSIDWPRELQQKNLEWLDDNLDSWKMAKRAALMKRMGAATEEVMAWWEQYREDDSAYRPLLELYEEYDLFKAVELVQEKRNQERNTGWQITDYTKTLLRLYEKAGDQVRYEKELRYLVLERGCQETDYLSRLKNCTPPEEWGGMFAAILAEAKRPFERMHLYHFEAMYDALVEELTQYPYLENFRTYEPSLREWDSERTLKLYVDALKFEMDRVCDRKEYRRVVGHLRELEAYPGGGEEARKLAAYWHEYYKRRSAMKDELCRAGYPENEVCDYLCRKV